MRNTVVDGYQYHQEEGAKFLFEQILTDMNNEFINEQRMRQSNGATLMISDDHVALELYTQVVVANALWNRMVELMIYPLNRDGFKLQMLNLIKNSDYIPNPQFRNKVIKYFEGEG